MKLLTIVIPSYNTADIMEKNIVTMIDERITEDVEILIIDDGSEDNTFEKAQEFQRAYPETVRAISKENGGHGSVINRGIEEAKGIYFKVIDGDDWVDKDGLVSLVSEIRQMNRYPDFILNALVEVDKESGKEKIIRKRIREGEIEEILEIIDDLKQIRVHGLTVRTEIFRQNKIFFTEKCYYEDFEFVLFPLMYVKTVVYFDTVVYRYLIGQEQQSVSDDMAFRNVGMAFKVLKDSVKFVEGRSSDRGDYFETKIGRYIRWSILNNTKSIYNIFLRNMDKKNAFDKMICFDKRFRDFSEKWYRAAGFRYPYIWLLRTRRKSIAYVLAILLQLYRRMNR